MPGLISKDEMKYSMEFYERIHQVQVDYLYYWKEHTLWHKEFWVSLALAIIPWLVWVLIRKRGSEARLLLAGCFGLIVATWFDFLGIVFGLWHYSGRLVPTIPSFFPWDYSLIPVSLMLSLQFKPNLNPFLKAVIFSALTAFIGEPLFMLLGFYTEIKWSVFYSFSIYILIYLISDRISKAKSFDTL